MKISIKQAAETLKISRARLYELIQLGVAHAQTESLSGMKYLTGAELQRLQALERKPGRPKKNDNI